VILNSAAGLVASGRARDFKDGIKLAAESIDSGAAMKKLEMLKQFTNRT
jgi:anthranilate phosphoribosyltransferase